MSEHGEDLPRLETVSADDALGFMRAQIAAWDFKEHSEENNAYFLTQLGHWAIETFGQEDSDGNWDVYPAAGYGEGFDHSELPFDLQQIVMTESYGETYAGNDNSVRIRSAHMMLEDDPVIPKWEDISKLPTYSEQLEAISSDPEVMAGLQVSRFSVYPGIEVTFKPALYFEWGLQYICQSRDIRVIPFGKQGHTIVPFQYAAERREASLNNALVLADLIMLGIRHAHRPASVPLTALDTLTDRLTGKKSIPLANLRTDARPGNSIKNLLIKKALDRNE